MPYKNPSVLETSGTFDTMRGLHPSVFKQLLPPEPLSYPEVNFIIKGPVGKHKASLWKEKFHMCRQYCDILNKEM